MPRYFFHMTAGAHCCWDQAGLEQPDLAAAHRHALRLVHRVLRDVVRLNTRERWAVRVCSADGVPELVVLFPAGNSRAPGPRPAVPPRPPGASRDAGRLA